jgi:hypothetical protein
MIRFISLFALFILLSIGVTGQIRLDKLILEPKQEYKILGSDILVVDTLIMRDSSRIILNRDVKENIINAKMLIVGKGCIIYGRGADGDTGKPGAQGISQAAPCRSGGDGSAGLNGIKGTDGLLLSLYTNNIKISGSLIIDLNGGNGGNGGLGGHGGDGGAGTRVCRGGNGGTGAGGGNAANGGNGGNLTMTCKECFDLHIIKGEKLIIKNYGGLAGSPGEGGRAGRAGLGPVKDGKIGARGGHGANGVIGKAGVLKFGK